MKIRMFKTVQTGTRFDKRLLAQGTIVEVDDSEVFYPNKAEPEERHGKWVKVSDTDKPIKLAQYLVDNGFAEKVSSAKANSDGKDLKVASQLAEEDAPEPGSKTVRKKK